MEQLPMSQLQQPKCRRHHSHCRQTLPWHSCPSCSAQQVNVSNSKQPEAGRLGMRLLRCQSPRAAFPIFCQVRILGCKRPRQHFKEHPRRTWR